MVAAKAAAARDYRYAIALLEHGGTSEAVRLLRQLANEALRLLNQASPPKPLPAPPAAGKVVFERALAASGRGQVLTALREALGAAEKAAGAADGEVTLSGTIVVTAKGKT